MISNGSQFCKSAFNLRHKLSLKRKDKSHLNALHYQDIKFLENNIEDDKKIKGLIFDSIMSYLEKQTLYYKIIGDNIIFDKPQSMEQMNLEKLKVLMRDKNIRKELFELRQSTSRFTLNFDDSKALYRTNNGFFYMIDDIQSSAITSKHVSFSETFQEYDIEFERYIYWIDNKEDEQSFINLLDSYNYIPNVAFKKKKITITDMYTNIYE